MRFIGFYDYTVILTYLSLASAVLGIMLSGQDRFTGAILCLVLSGLCDGFDGTVARSKKGRTDDEKAFGIQIDSLSDLVCFCVLPATVMLCLQKAVLPDVDPLWFYPLAALYGLVALNKAALELIQIGKLFIVVQAYAGALFALVS